MENRAELLAPAGTWESMTAAFAAGADAVYLGGSRFGARAYAGNLDQEQLLRGIDYAHLLGKHLYLTVNTLVKDGEMDLLYEDLLPLYREGLDAVIVQDLGVLTFLREIFPELPLHASTQMTITGPKGAAFLKRQGVSRVVTARELSLEEIRAIYRETGMEIESFVHGALCYCYSGQCLLSSMIGGRSGNRGRCAQPCRLPYTGVTVNGKRCDGYLMSPKDICTLDILPEILESGVCSLKIEGRMKSTEYTAGVTSVYRKYLDRYYRMGKEDYRVEPEDLRILMDLYNRGGFSTGYYQKRNGPDMMSMERPGHWGTLAAEPIKSGKGWKWKAAEDLYPGDVLELRGGVARSLETGSCDAVAPGRESMLCSGETRGKRTMSRSSAARGKGKTLCREAARDRETISCGEIARKQNVMFYNGNTRGQEVVLRNLVQRGQIVPLPFAPEKGAIMARTRNERLLQELKDRFSESEKKKKINGKLILFVGKSVILELTCEDFCVTVSGAEVQQAQKRPLTEEEAARQIRKTGDSFFEFETLTVQMDPDVFLPVQALKELRRTALAQLEELLLSSYRREEQSEETGGCRQKARNACDASEKEGTETSAPDIWVCVETQEQLSAALDFPEISGVYLDAGMYHGKKTFLREGARDLAACRAKDRHCFLALPWIWREDGRTALFEDAEVVSLLRKFDGMLIRNAEEAEYLLRLDYRGDRRTDANVYRWNRWSEKFWGGQGFPVGTFPLELTARELKESGARDTELIVYGAMPLMISAQCLKKNISGCDGIPAVLELQDRKRQRFRVKTHCAYCYTVLYNSVPTDLAGDAQLVRETGANRVRIQLTTENAEESRKVIAREIRAFSCGETVDLSGESFTRGHLKRKVE